MYCDFKRGIVPNAYSSKKTNQAIIWNEESQVPVQTLPEQNTNDDKENVREEIRQKINAMNDLDCIEVHDDSDIEDLQSIIGNDENDPDIFFPPVNKIPNRNHKKILHFPMENLEVDSHINQYDDVNWLLRKIKLHIPDQYSCSYVSLF